MKQMKQVLLVLAVMALAGSVYSHCQIPCGIYDDEARFTELSEHLTTIEKSMKEINALSEDASGNVNQAVRWVNNKEHHADAFTKIIVDYFLVQRINEVDSNNAEYSLYVKKLNKLHLLLRYAMKCKQTTEVVHVETMRANLQEFKELYLNK